jgi:hypothetical protein
MRIHAHRKSDNDYEKVQAGKSSSTHTISIGVPRRRSRAISVPGLILFAGDPIHDDVGDALSFGVVCNNMSRLVESLDMVFLRTDASVDQFCNARRNRLVGG